ncbi:TIGR04438 family Trp-rich protein [Paraherbaspirillum soli]|uniref:TIGR04438 family Trp-rich protein n=1 Tax=Paraherbaspirillum soli TaxID=631222 RepID=A0ABW0ME26_9BURK
MPLIIIIVLLLALKYFAIGPFADISWWWISGLMTVAFIFFEFLEPMLGLDKRRAHDEMEKIQKERVNKTFDKHKRPRR